MVTVRLFASHLGDCSVLSMPSCSHASFWFGKYGQGNMVSLGEDGSVCRGQRREAREAGPGIS